MTRAMPILLLTLGCFVNAAQAGPVDYLRDVKPLLAAHCYSCHGKEKQKGDLRVNTAAAIRMGGYSGPAIVPGKAEESLLVQALTGAEDVTQMPLGKKPIPDEQIALIRDWIDQGAVAPENESEEDLFAIRRNHWSFKPPQNHTPPSVTDLSWARNPIDSFILARLEKEGIKPSREADRITLIRRLSLDLLGLPPSLDEIDKFMANDRPDAYEQLVDRLFASPHFGERWGRHWLDLARYADSNGYSIDGPREIWKYRDWVINAINNDMPYDEFVIAQLAGDLLPEKSEADSRQNLVATGFHRNTMINQEGGVDKEQFRVEAVVDRVNTTGEVILGLTVGCAQCHDHKFDPISQREYYQLFAFFNSTDDTTINVGSPEEIGKQNAIRRQMQLLEAEMAAQEKKWRETQSEEKLAGLKPDLLKILDMPPSNRNLGQKATVWRVLGKEIHGLSEYTATLRSLRRREPDLPTTLVLKQRGQPRQTHIHIAGDFVRQGDPVTPGVPEVLPSLDGANLTRLNLAKWLVHPDNPLTARVAVNRFWQQLFGTGLVETSNDFGTQGTPPTHPQLLDWLAQDFISQEFSIKKMLRRIVTSSTYRQSSHERPDLAVKDPNNRLLARQSRLRLEAEVVRDVALASSGLLDRKIGGASVFPLQPKGVYQLTQKNKNWRPSRGSERYRRGMYTYFWRSAPHPALMVFDAPTAQLTCTRRIRSNTPLQALTLLNDKGYFEFAQGLAARVLKEAEPHDFDRLVYTFRLCMGRRPNEKELDILTRVLDQHRHDFDLNASEAKSLVTVEPPPGSTARDVATWTVVARVMMNLDEFITRE